METRESTSSGDEAPKFKVVLLGEGCVGKTCMVMRFVENKFTNKHVSTLQAAFFTKKMNIAGKRAELAIWDTAGQERFHALGPIYYRDSQGAVLVYDITDEDSFQKVKNWVKELRKMLGDTVRLVLAGNKSDLEKDRRVKFEEAEEYAGQVGAKHFSTSAKNNQGIDELFLELTKGMLEEYEKSSTLKRRPSQRRNRSLLVDSASTDQNAQEKKKCCT